MGKQVEDKDPKKRWPHMEVAPEVDVLVGKANIKKQQKKYFNTAIALKGLEAIGEQIPKEVKEKYGKLLI